MNVNSQVNGFFLLLSFGLLQGVIAGILFGLGMALYWQTVGRFGDDVSFLFVLSGIGAAYGVVPGVLYGLSSYYFISKSDWLFTGGLYGFIPGFVLFFGLGLYWPILLLCVSYGVFAGFINLQFPNWWGMQLRAEGIELLRPKN